MATESSNIIRLCVDAETPMGLYEYELPAMPREEEIWYYDLKKKDQYWKTPAAGNRFKWLTPTGGLKNVNHMSAKEQVEYIEYWRDKWEHGLWVMMNGEPTYLTGMHIDHLVFNKFKSGNFFYDDAQRLRFYFRDLTNRDNLCDGRLWAKGRRVGITSEEITEAIRTINSGFSNHIGAQSDTYPKAKSTILNKIIDAYTKRPKWMREDFYSSNGQIPREKLELTANKIISDEENYPLGGIARAFPTTAKAMDGEEFMLVIMDEISKWEDVSPRETMEVNIKTIVNPGKRGKLDALSTTGDSKQAEKSVRDWHQLIADSNPKVRNANGKTNSGLYYYFVSYAYSFELWERYPQIKDKYGKVNLAMAEEIIWNEIKKHPKDSKPYVFALYKMPTLMRHTLLTASNQGYFSKIRISHRLEVLRALPYDRKPYVIGSLEYDKDGKVYFESNKEREIRCERDGDQYIPGHWMIAVHPFVSIERGINLANRYRKDGEGVCYPPVNPEGGIGFDPIRYRKEDTTSTNLSEAAIIVYKKLDYFNAGDSNRYCGLYLDRPDDPRDANRECIKACKYWGYPMMYERVMDGVKEDFEEANMVPFMLINPKDKIQGMIIDSGGKTVKNALNEMQTEFAAPKTAEDIDMIEEMPFEPVLVDLDGLDIAKTTKYDVFMAMVELKYALRQVVYTNLTDQSEVSRMQLMKEIFPPQNR